MDNPALSRSLDHSLPTRRLSTQGEKRHEKFLPAKIRVTH
jgi:hypothetical protein